MRLGLYFVVLIAGMALPCVAHAQDARTLADDQRASSGGALKEQISVRVENIQKLLSQADAAKTKPVLFLNGHEMTNIFGTPVGDVDANGTGTLTFLLDRDPSNRDAWKPFLSRPDLAGRTLTLSVGLPGQPPIASNWVNFHLTVIHKSWLVAWVIAFLFLLAIFFKIAGATPLLREEGPAPPGGVAALSLAKCQMAWWFFLVLTAFAFLYMVTWDFNTITTGTLALIGISAGTGLAGAVVDSSKNTQLLAEQKQLQTELAAGAVPARAAQIGTRLNEINTELATPAHISFVSDLLTDSEGISFHRFQMVVWTIVFGIVFVVSVYNDMIMPDFSATLLGLMGISSGTYVGFKFPETKN